MKISAAPILLMIILVLITLIPFRTFGQEENALAATHGNRYISLKIRSLNKYNSRIEHQQGRLLKKLKKKEKHFAHKLQRQDSAAYAHYQKQPVSFDSISKIAQDDNGATAARIPKRKNPAIDSLKGVASFVESKTGLPTPSTESGAQNAELSKLQGKLNYRSYVNDLITKRSNELKNLNGSGSNVPGVMGIQKQVFYSKAKMKVFKEMEEEPDKAEEAAMEYLQGCEGFNKYLASATGDQALGQGGSNAGAAALAKAGYQTKQQLQGNLQQKLGGNLGKAITQVSDNLSKWNDKRKELTADAKQSKQTFKQTKSIAKPTFKVNPMRGLPFRKRIEKQYNWQVTRAGNDDAHPAVIEPSAMLGFKHTAKLTYGMGLAGDIGLGQSWQRIRLSFQGIGLRSFATWKWQYGIAAYAGYERLYKPYAFTKTTTTPNTDVIQSLHNTQYYNESILIGLTKSYNINKKYAGSIQLLFDIWWQQKGLNTPLILRFATTKK